jgi:hypothetical protein
MTEAIFKKRKAGHRLEVGLFPCDEEGGQLLFKIPDMRDVEVDITVRRNPRHHRLFFAICKFVQMHCELFSDASVDEIKDALKLATGLVKRYVSTETAQTYYVMKSISFSAMDQTAFGEFYQNAVDVVCKRWMPPGTLPADVHNELIAMVDGPHALDERRTA